ncbi:MAG TPA: pilus assembly protein PilP [Coxiellaceae bacterium]|nr:MAG: hypothetical protein A3E81_08445 [Gammaproteobacteria bacterium RIFCSPHIGHO2_12_FULL_36_30]HLB55754.1 pilus assembly protein PilP [Coxiellaceae bacterium]
MKYNRLFIIFLLSLCMITLNSCGEKNKESPTEQVAKFVQQVEAAAKLSEKNKSSKQATIAQVEYTGSDLRDPFELTAAVKNVKEYPNSILTDTSIDSLKLIGIVMHKDTRWALFRSSDGRLYVTTEGMRLGLQHALLTQITADEVKFSIDESSTGGEAKREVVMSIKEFKQ